MLRLNHKATSLCLPYPFKVIQNQFFSVEVNLSRLHNFFLITLSFEIEQNKKISIYKQKYMCSSQNASDPLSKNPEVYL